MLTSEMMAVAGSYSQYQRSSPFLVERASSAITFSPSNYHRIARLGKAQCLERRAIVGDTQIEATSFLASLARSMASTLVVSSNFTRICWTHPLHGQLSE